jgi:hypothetical protein
MENIPYNRRVKFHGCLLRIDGAKISSVWGLKFVLIMALKNSWPEINVVHALLRLFNLFYFNVLTSHT